MGSAGLRVGVAGAGHFGRHHALKVAASERALLAGIYDPDEERAKTVGWEAGAPSLAFESLLAGCDALIVAAPAEAHHQLAAAALRGSKHVLVEKPIAATLEEADDLAALSIERGLVLQVGHLEQFSAAHGAVAGRMGRPLYIEATRIAPFKTRGTDVSVILDLMIHDLDLILSLVESPSRAWMRSAPRSRARTRTSPTPAFASRTAALRRSPPAGSRFGPNGGCGYSPRTAIWLSILRVAG